MTPTNIDYQGTSTYFLTQFAMAFTSFWLIWIFYRFLIAFDNMSLNGELAIGSVIIGIIILVCTGGLMLALVFCVSSIWDYCCYVRDKFYARMNQ